MKTREPSLTYFGVFPLFFRGHAHRLIALGYEDARHRIRSDDEETDITGFITKAIKDRLRVIDCPRWYNHYSVSEDQPVEDQLVKKKVRSGKSRLRPDIIIESNVSGRPEYTFEAKRLQRNRHGIGQYIGSKGMGCFVSGRYASRYDEAAMLGYVQSDSLGYWRDKIKVKIDKSADKLCLKPPQRDVKVIDALPMEWASDHERDSLGRPITIYHILLDCFAYSCSLTV